MTTARYRIGLVVDGPEVPKWVRDLADWASSHSEIEIGALIIGPGPRRRGAVERLLAFERFFLRFSATYRSYARLYPIAGCAEVEFRATGGRGGSIKLEAVDLSKLRALSLDVLVQCGNGAAAPELVAATRDGMLFLSAGAGGAAANSGTGLLEVIDGRPDTRFAIERALSSSHAPETLFTGSISTHLTFAANMIALHARAFGYMRLVLQRLATGTAQPLRHDRSLHVPQTVSAAALLTYVARTGRRSLGKAHRRLFRHEFNWRVAFAPRKWTDAGWRDGRPIANPDGSFLADPFTMCVDGVHFIFVEQFPFKSRKGVISAYRIDGDDARHVGVVLEEPYHLSFPFVFRHGGETFMMPESGAGRCLKLYKSADFPGQWQEVRVVLDNVAAVDSIVFEHRGLWWLLTTINGDGPALNNAELHAFYASDPLGEWTPHRNNPIVMDSRRGRNGGFLRDEHGHPHRVAQVPGFTFYGAGAAIYRIDELSPDTYSERLVTEVRADTLGLDGTHHIHSSDGLTVFDFMRVERPPSGRRRAFAKE